MKENNSAGRVTMLGDQGRPLWIDMWAETRMVGKSPGWRHHPEGTSVFLTLQRKPLDRKVLLLMGMHLSFRCTGDRRMFRSTALAPWLFRVWVPPDQPSWILCSAVTPPTSAPLAMLCCCLVTKSCQLFAIPWALAVQAPLSMGFSRWNTGVGCYFLLQGITLMEKWAKRL